MSLPMAAEAVSAHTAIPASNSFDVADITCIDGKEHSKAIREHSKAALAEATTQFEKLQTRTAKLLEISRRNQEQFLRMARVRVADLVDIQTIDVLESIIRACSDLMFDDRGDEARRKVLNDLPTKYNNITSVLSCNPTASKNMEIKKKALALISPDQLELASALNRALNDTYFCSILHHLPHLRTTKAAALNLVKDARDRLKLSSKNISQIEDLLNDCPRPLPNANITCFFLDDESKPCRDTWQEALDGVTYAEEELRDLEQMIAKVRQEEESLSILSKHY